MAADAVLLDRARNGDELAFQELVQAHRGELHAHCYRMLGSVHDAEDALQDAFLRAWRFLPRFQGRASVRSWLYRICTNTCLDLLGKRPRRVVPLEHGPAGDPHEGPGAPLTEIAWLEPYPDEVLGLPEGRATPEARFEQREAVELAFVAALQHLAPKQRAVLILCEVLGFSAKEAGEVLETTVASVNSALQRARAAVDERLPERSQQATLRTLGDTALREAVDRYLEAWERGDVAAVASMLAEEAVLTMPPMPTWYAGREQVLVFLREWAFNGRVYDALGDRRVKVLPARAGGQPAIGTYSWSPEAGVHLPSVLQVLSFDDAGRVTAIEGFVRPDLFPAFGLPRELQ